MSLTSNVALVAAGQASRTASVLNVFSYLFIVAGVLSLLGTSAFLWVWEPGLAGMLVSLALASVPLALGVFSRVASNQSTKSRDTQLELAYAEHLIATLQQLERSFDARTLAGWLGLPLPKTEAILSRLNADDRMRSDITDDGEVVYGALSAAPTYRVEAFGASAQPMPAPRVEGYDHLSPPEPIVDAEFEEALDAHLKRQQKP